MNGIGNENTLTIHLTDCKFALMISESNFVPFEEIFHAINEGYYECDYCLGRGMKRYYEKENK